LAWFIFFFKYIFLPKKKRWMMPRHILDQTRPDQTSVMRLAYCVPLQAQHVTTLQHPKCVWAAPRCVWAPHCETHLWQGKKGSGGGKKFKK
jgi:hypothetical protein